MDPRAVLERVGDEADLDEVDIFEQAAMGRVTRGVRMGGEDGIRLPPHGEIEFPAREGEERDAPPAQLLMQVFADKARAACDEYLSLDGRHGRMGG